MCDITFNIFNYNIKKEPYENAKEAISYWRNRYKTRCGAICN